MKRNLLALALGAAFCSGAMAAPISLPEGPVYFQFNNLEQISTTNNITVPGGAIDVTGDGTADTPATEGNWGVFNVSSMQYGGIATPNQDISGGTAFFFDDGVGDTLAGNPTNQGQVSGIFYGITLTSGTTATGGYLDIYWEDAATDDITSNDLTGAFAPTNRTTANQAGIFTDGALVVRLAFASGIISGDSVTTISSSIDVGNITGSGQADSFANVVDINNDGVIDGADGAWASGLNGDWFFVDIDGDGIFGETGETRDLRFSNFFNLLASWDGTDAAGNPIIGVRSNDPGRAYVVPEPATLGLLGLGLLGMGFASRRRKAA